MISPTIEQGRMLRFVAGYLETHDGIAPTLRTIADALGYASTASVHRKLEALEERGLIRRLRNRPQSIELVQPVSVPRAPDGAPLYFIPAGRVSAALPL
jgi:repressor LexA